MKFIALPVAQGDAFYAQTDDGFRVLVDGGRSRRALPGLFRRYTKADHVDVLVCTHNDADHTEGIIGFLESELSCEELWLPATWLDAVLNLPANAEEIVDFLWEQLFDALHYREPQSRQEVGEGTQQAAWRILLSALPPEAGPDNDDGEVSTAQEQEPPISLGVFLEEALPALEEHIHLLEVSLRQWWRYYAYPIGRWRYDQLSYTGTVLEDTHRLLEVARLALDRGIPIRCFRHNPRSAAAAEGYPLLPLSAKPVHCVGPARVRRTAREFFCLAFLTTVNKQSLVFCLQGGNQPGVLFTADSDLEDVNLGLVACGDIATAPHHGAKDNKLAYTKVGRPVIWVRSDGHARSRPCAEYLSATGWRFCTLCRNSGRPKQAVQLYTRQRRWVRRLTLPCDCQ